MGETPLIEIQQKKQGDTDEVQTPQGTLITPNGVHEVLVNVETTNSGKLIHCTFFSFS